jgi:hypothetical protein
MAYEILNLGHGRQAIRVPSGRTCQIVQQPDGTWTVIEDDAHRVFTSYGAALSCAREIAGDPDLPPLTRV